MVDTKWGKRYTCFKCDARFYDMNKPKAICPKCEANQSKAPQKGALSAAAKARRKLMPDEETDDDEAKGNTDNDSSGNDNPIKGEI